MKQLIFFEWRQMVRERVFLFSLSLVPLFFLLSFVGLLNQNQEACLELSGVLGGLLYTVSALVAGFSVAFFADSFAGERERKTLETLFLSPLTLKQVFWGKVLAAGVFPLGLGFLCQGLMVALSYLMGCPIWMATGVVAAMLFNLFNSMLLGSVFTLISVRTETVRSAAQWSSVVFLIYMVIVTAISPYLNKYPWLVLPFGVFGVFVAFFGLRWSSRAFFGMGSF